MSYGEDRYKGENRGGKAECVSVESIKMCVVVSVCTYRLTCTCTCMYIHMYTHTNFKETEQ